MHWNFPYGTNSGSNSGGQPPTTVAQAIAQQIEPSRKINELVANRQQNQAGIWNGGSITLSSSPLTLPTAQWDSPTFDLRPDLPYLSQGDKSSTPVYRSRTGDWGSLWVLIEGLNQQFGAWYGFSGLRVLMQEFTSPIDPTLVRAINDPVDITSEFSVDITQPIARQKQATLLQLKATNDVDPIRYYQVRLYFSWNIIATVPIQLRVQSAYF